MTREPIIELRDVVKRYDTGGEVVEALKGIDFAAEPGEFVAVMGPSGSGKSTMLNVLGLLDGPTEGQVFLDGRDVTDLSEKEETEERKRSIGFVFQNFYLIPTLTATENVEMPTLFGDDPDARERAEELLTRVGLGDRLEHRPNELSGGQKQRVAIARALINSPRILLADEPTGNLDQKTGRSVLELFLELTEERDVAIIAVTHDPQVSKYADRTITLVDGRMQAWDVHGSGETDESDEAVDSDDAESPDDASGERDGEATSESEATGESKSDPSELPGETEQ